MSIDIDWERATSGPDGDILAERIRSFIHDKFQQIALPRFIRSVQVNSFSFGSIPPDLEIRDLCDPFPDFYEEDEDADLSDSPVESPCDTESIDGHLQSGLDPWRKDHSGVLRGVELQHPFRGRGSSEDYTALPPLRSPMNFGDPLNPYIFPRAGTPGIPGGTSNLGYYYMPLSGISGTQTPLGAVARGHRFSNSKADPISVREQMMQGIQNTRGSRRLSEVDIDSAQSRPSTANTLASIGSLNAHDPDASNVPRAAHSLPHSDQHTHPDVQGSSPAISVMDNEPHIRRREPKPEDFQVLCRVKYAGDIKLSLTAEILLDYPMPSFVGLPLKLNITGLTFDGVAVLAYIRRRLHFCFLSPEDADTLLGDDSGTSNDPHPRANEGSPLPTSPRRIHPSLLREIRVESEIGRKENGKQALKNVGKVENFVLEQVRRIFEEEFVYPSYWTFLV
ncbi:hypothetical protein AJ80_00062 [Polytolypa hystricis UAMH7299]|uniref:Mitochondrial distribution and morphology protein 12 n=1 Tax=Polytolypa hystricis (strain UAMH7299) TaxID=1447883 RepID=A0A2B7Z559_POLH7|nr:hypothetical protein AJ80_00062 [Polytolypa hystricis UAMH7299]